MAQYNLMTVQKGRAPLWKPEEIQAILKALENGDRELLERDERVSLFVEDRHDQLVALGVTELDPVGMVAACIGLCDRSFPRFRDYIVHIMKQTREGNVYIMPSRWANGRRHL